MEVRFAAGLILIAVGALLTLMGGFGVFMPNQTGAGLRLGCGAVGLVGNLAVVLGLRLRNKAVAESSELKQALEGNNSGPTTRTETTKPSFLTKSPAPAPPAPAPEQQPQPGPRPRSSPHLIYWIIVAAFVLVVVGLMIGTLGFFKGRQQFRVVSTVVLLLAVLLFPLAWIRRGNHVDGSSSSDGGDSGSGD